MRALDRTLLSAVLGYVLIGGVCTAMPSAAWSQQPGEATPAVDQRPSQNASALPEVPPETPEDEIAPAALTLNFENASPLIRELYFATRETKEKDILARLDHAKSLLGSADLKATDAQGRTALHWAVFGSSYSTNQKVIVAYEGLADAMISRGVDINREDIFQDTAFDYLLYSPNFEMQTLLMENGATSGFLATSYQPDQGSAEGVARAMAAPTATMSRTADLVPGATLSIRLDGPVYSDRSRTGDPVEGTVTYPLCKNGEQIECKQGELIVPPGTKVNGTILFAQKAPDKYSRPRLVLDFSNIVHKDGEYSPLYARLISVDNARETVQNNEILGIIQPHAKSKISLAFTALGSVNPIAGYTIKGVQTVYGLSIRREILFPEGTDVQVQVVRPSSLKEKDQWAGWPRLPLDGALQHLVETAPLRTATPGEKPSDLTNMIFLGSEQQLIAAFGEAGWTAADSTNVRSALKAVQATLRQTGYSDAPVSALRLEGRPPDIVLQKSLNTFAKRHHIRIWKMPTRYNGRDVWVGAATHDIATMNARAGTKWSHRIDPHVDRERDWVLTDLLFVGTASSYVDVDRPRAPKKTTNATGDNILTDGKVSVVMLGPAGAQAAKASDMFPQNRERP